MIEDLIVNVVSNGLKGSKLSWISGAKRWFAMTQIEAGLDKNFKKEIIEYYYKIKKKRIKTKYAKLAMRASSVKTIFL